MAWSRSARDSGHRRQGEVVATAAAFPCPAMYVAFLAFQAPWTSGSPIQSVKMCPRPRASASSSSAIMCPRAGVGSSLPEPVPD